MNTVISFLRQLFPPTYDDRIFMVGGIVRDFLLGRETRDIDLIAALSSDEFISLGFRLVESKSTTPIWLSYHKEFGTIEVSPLSDRTELNIDLACRDFTVNALAMSLSGNIIDPLNGRSDLNQRLLRPCDSGSFIHDPLRIFRGFRFECDGWRMTQEATKFIRERDWTLYMQDIPIERFSREMLKAIESPEPERFFQRMLEFKVGDNYLPEVFRMIHVSAGPLIHHPEGDLFTHSCQVLQRVAQHSADPLARFCAFFHDIGKLATDPVNYPKHHGHNEAGFGLALAFCDRLRLPSRYRTALAWTSRLHAKLNMWANLRDSTKVRTAEQAVKAGIADIIPIIAAADKTGGLDLDDWSRTVRIARMTIVELGIDPVRLDDIPVRDRSDAILQKRVEVWRASRLRTPDVQQ